MDTFALPASVFFSLLLIHTFSNPLRSASRPIPLAATYPPPPVETSDGTSELCLWQPEKDESIEPAQRTNQRTNESTIP
ncbi:unnamed protein product [Periconia digitata]|uniref:Secreted protein n=1 Tax=Periconia digitata TaxID=1303443 RepID=A0A9W4UDP2_9PLEO|nr:unnamed protein product [Periconia digitata]